MDDQVLLPPSRPPRAPGQEPSARLTLDAYQRMRKLATSNSRRMVEVAQQILAAEDAFRAIEEVG